MKKKKSIFFLSTFITLLLLIVFATNLSALIYYNDTGDLFGRQPVYAVKILPLGVCNAGLLPCAVLVLDTPSMRLGEKIGKGAAHFLKFNAYISFFFSNVEQAGIDKPDYQLLRSDMNHAVRELKLARTIYTRLKSEAQMVPYHHYDKDLIARLKGFDYDTFEKQHRLKKDVVDKVKAYLTDEKFVDMYEGILLDTERMLRLTLKIKSKVEAGEFPGESELWDLNLAISDSLLLGQYAAKIFREVKAGNSK
jgi:hypothetical protein